MGMNEALRARLQGAIDRANNKRQNDLYKPTENKTERVRILPYGEDGYPFEEVFFHYGVGKGAVRCPKRNNNEPCAICEFVSELYDSGNDASVQVAKDIRAKVSYFTPVLIREGEEAGEAKWFRLNKTNFTYVVGKMMDEDYGMVQDPVDGIDLKVTLTPKDPAAGQNWPKTELDFARKNSPLIDGDDDRDLDEIMESLKPLVQIYGLSTPEEVKERLSDYLDGDAKATDTSIGTVRGSGSDDAVEAAVANL